MNNYLGKIFQKATYNMTWKIKISPAHLAYAVAIKSNSYLIPNQIFVCFFKSLCEKFPSEVKERKC